MKRSMPGFARPMELSIPTSVSAIRTGVFPSRGSGVTVFVTNASRLRATSGAMSASRHPEALSSTEHRSLDTQTLELAVDLHRAAVARAVAASHRRLPRQLCRGGERAHRLQHRLGPAGEDVHPCRDQLRHEGRLDAGLGVRYELSSLGVAIRAETEYGGRPLKRFRQVGQRSDPDSPTYEQRPLQVEIETVPERTEHVDGLAARELAEHRSPGPDRIDEESELAAGREAEAHRARQHATGCLEHEELSGHAGVHAAARDTQQRVRADLLVRDDAKPLASHARFVPEAPAARATLRCGRWQSHRPRPSHRTVS